jgi:2-keto-4-pentenoate hydratase
MNLRELAVRQLNDYDRHQPGTVFAELGLELSIDNAYDLRFRVAELREARGERIAGYKIGCISRTMQQQLGLDHPVFGHVWEPELRPSGTTLQAEDFDGLAIEGEFAVRLATDVSSARWLRTHPQVIGTGFVVIELHNYVFRGSSGNRAAELVANNAIHAGVVLPTADPPLDGSNTLRDAILQVERSGEVLGASTGAQLESGLIERIAHLAEHLERYGRRLHCGEVVLTGSPLPLWRVSGGDSIKVWSEEFGVATCRIKSYVETDQERLQAL